MTSYDASLSSPFVHGCGHLCILRVCDECCQCSDSRPHEDHGYTTSSLSNPKGRVNKSHAYCRSCQHRILIQKTAKIQRQDYPINRLLLNQQRILHTQEHDLRMTYSLANRIHTLETILKAKDAEIRYLQVALTRR